MKVNARSVLWCAKHLTVLAIGAWAALFVSGEVANWRRLPEVKPVPAVAPQTERVAEAPRVTVDAPLTAPQVAPRVLRKIVKDYGKPVATVDTAGTVVDDTGHAIPGGSESTDLLLAEVELPRMSEGGGAIVTRTPGGAVEVTVRAKPRRFLELRSEWSIGALVDPTGGGDWRGYARWSGLRLGRVHAIVEAGGLRHGGSSGGYVMVGAELRFGGGS